MINKPACKFCENSINNYNVNKKLKYFLRKPAKFSESNVDMNFEQKKWINLFVTKKLPTTSAI